MPRLAIVLLLVAVGFGVREYVARSSARAPAIAAAPVAAGTLHWPELQRRFAPMPAADTRGSPYRAADVRRRIEDSVYLLWVDRGIDDRWTHVGSAVAVSNDTLLTNCHVLGSDPRRLTLRQGGRSATPSLLIGDERSDRCFIRVTGLSLAPVAGVRALNSVSVGETVFSLGNPAGQERVFGAGAVIGVRPFNGLAVIETSAPMAPGSSGGGLFDAWGNLLGITSFQLASRGTGAAGNYAIAAAEFWR